MRGGGAGMGWTGQGKGRCWQGSGSNYFHVTHCISLIHIAVNFHEDIP